MTITPEALARLIADAFYDQDSSVDDANLTETTISDTFDLVAVASVLLARYAILELPEPSLRVDAANGVDGYVGFEAALDTITVYVYDDGDIYAELSSSTDDTPDELRTLAAALCAAANHAEKVKA
ncbi:hypothetical protein DW322_11185 [Rhodococcus rhodnii]|uniref:Uncharacterized protein n=2 Tax=Rhodococcus rhodnii TaxID=38312 RepID=R7WRT2_9NOCA|nr:hypothetical protein [Rhodococcus rhodnii]EOM78047.1 hypothetical protein Rrhod_0588 [Rhodococcus rhodnii LMG 5362]TXG90675.1 hypothetical protein DW322_11185 [Rhodococcus rhodnii]